MSMTPQRRRALLLLDDAFARAEAVAAEVRARQAAEQQQPTPPVAAETERETPKEAA